MNMVISKADEKRLEQLFAEAIALRDLGNLRDTLAKLAEILSEQTKFDAPVLGLMGNIYWDLNDFTKALECYRKAVVIKPKSELASLGLFHTLWNLGKRDEAFDEMRRFLSISSSEEYSRLLSEMNQ